MMLRSSRVLCILLTIQSSIFLLLVLNSYNKFTSKKAKRILRSAFDKYLHSSDLNDSNLIDGIEKCSYSACDVTDELNVLDMKLYSFENIKQNLIDRKISIKKGGISFAFNNHDCISTANLAIIVPYRNRINHLKWFLSNMHPFLTRQQINYGIYLVEPKEGLAFNRGLLKNIGFVEAVKDEINNGDIKWNCFIFHDVDFYPENNKNIYQCHEKFPLHLAVQVQQFGRDKFKVKPLDYWGGVFSVTKDQYSKLNGISNLFFGWGGPDDDFFNRVMLKYGHFEKISFNVGRYSTPNSDHKRDQNPKSYQIKEFLKKRISKSRLIDEGLSTLQYKVLHIEKNDLFTRIIVDYNQQVILKYGNIDKLFYKATKKISYKIGHQNKSFFKFFDS